MYDIIKASNEEKQILFQNTAEKMKMHPAIIEKDFWVVMLLDYLFHVCPWKHAFTFKGGTSLSKGYQLIKRFSEDIDLILDWRVLGYGENEPWEERSKSKQEQFNKEANQKAEIFLREQLLPVLQKELSEYFSIEANVYIDEDGALLTDVELLKRLQSLRKKIGDEKDIPYYCVAWDRVLVQLATKKPTTREEFLSIKGIRDRWFDNNGQAFMKEIRDHLEKQ